MTHPTFLDDMKNKTVPVKVLDQEAQLFFKPHREGGINVYLQQGKRSVVLYRAAHSWLTVDQIVKRINETSEIAKRPKIELVV